MGRNLQCGCLCHGSNGNRIGDEYFSCKGCYAASHMDHLPRKVIVTKAAPKRKPLKVKEGLVVGKDTSIKGIAKQVMNNIADAAEAVKLVPRTEMEKKFDLGYRVEPVEKPSGRKGVKITIGERKQFTPVQATTITTALKETMEAVHVCGGGSNCKHD